MIQISIPYLVDVVASVDGLRLQNSQALIDVYGPLLHARTQIDQIYNQSIYALALRTSRELATKLLGELNALLSLDLTKEIEPYQVYTLTNARDQFKTAFLAELGALPTFFATQKESYDTAILLNFGASLFPTSLIVKAPETAADAQQVGRALAFELPTAAGFHLYRVLEAVLRRYYSHVSNGRPAPKVRTIGVYVRAMRSEGCGEEMVLATLEQIRDLHRNPLVHPEQMLSTEDAITAIGIARSAISAMLGAMPDDPVA